MNTKSKHTSRHKSKPRNTPTVTKSARQPKSSELFLNREIQLLAFNRRVLAQAEDRKIPTLERLKFLTIVSSNLDEFFEIRNSS